MPHPGSLVSPASALVEGPGSHYSHAADSLPEAMSCWLQSTGESVVERSFSENEVKLLEFTPWLVQKNKGPASAKGIGACYFIGGTSHGEPLTSTWAVPYFFKTLSQSGWDVVEDGQAAEGPDRFL